MRYVKLLATIIILLFLFPVNKVNAVSTTYDESHLKPYLDKDGKILWGEQASFSYDGKLITYTAGDQTTQTMAIWVMNYDGTDIRMLYANNSIDYTFTGPRFSPGDDKIIFVLSGFDKKTDTFYQNITLLEKNGTEWNSNCTLRTLYTKEGGLQNPSYNTDGTKIVYESTDIYLMDADGSNHIKVTNVSIGDNARDPYFSPDGKKIIHLRWSDEGESELWIINSDGTNEKRLLDDSWYVHSPVYTPSGKILFTSSRLYPNSRDVGPPAIWMMDEDGSNKMIVAPAVFGGDIFSDYATMNANGTRIVFRHGMGDGYGLYYVDDPDGDGIWEDEDHDGIADVIDPDPNTIVTPQTALWAIVIISIGVAVVVIAYVYKKKQKKVVEDKKKSQYCMYCGQAMAFVQEYGKWYCQQCGQYR